MRRSEMSREEMMQAVKTYMAQGWVIHPLSRPDDPGKSPGKRPLLTGWQNLTETPEDIGAHIEQDCNIGLVCGKASGVDALDIDHDIFMGELLDGVEIDTLTSGHRKGRRHLLFQHDETMIGAKHHFIGIEYFGNSAKGGGTNLVVSPSIHYSGELYKWKNPETPVAKLSEKLKENMLALFKKEDALHDYFKKCRHCFTKGSKKYDIAVHGMDGRLAVLAIMGELKAHGCPNELMHTACKRFFGKDYNFNITENELGHIEPIHPKCETLRQFLNVECDGCNWKPTANKSNGKGKEKNIHNDIKSNGAFDYIDKIVEKTPIYYDEAGQFWLWNIAGFYRQVDNTEILLTLLIDIADPAIIQTKFKGELLEAARLRGRDARVKTVPTHWIHVQNGVYDIKTGELCEATPDYLFTDPIPHKIGDSEDTPTIDKLFSEWVAPEKVKLLNEIAAYCIYNGYPIHRMFILFGRGRNGKGQYRDFIVNLVGTQNRTASTLEQLINSRFETARLFNKKICTMGEINYTLLDRTAILKMLSGGDPIPGEMKNKAPFDYVNTAKLLINTNSLPQTSDKTDAFYSRCILVEFGQQFQLGKDIIETIPQEEYDNFLTKSLRVLRELLDRGEFTNEGDIRAKEVEYERLSNPLTQFISTNYEPDPNGTVAAWRIFEKYVAYCIEKGYRKPQNQRDFNNMLKINYEVEKKNKFDDEADEWVNWVWVIGIKLKDLPHLPNLPDVPLRSHIELSNDISGKSGKSGKSNNEQPDEKLPFDTIRTYAFETLFSISVDFFCIVYSILTNIRYAAPDYRHSNA
jgi:P4 family phage/plasmid primase-like protien